MVGIYAGEYLPPFASNINPSTAFESSIFTYLAGTLQLRIGRSLTLDKPKRLGYNLAIS